MLMCKEHWAQVPSALKFQVIKHYRSGQCADKRPSREWIAAARAAISHVATGEAIMKQLEAADEKRLDDAVEREKFRRKLNI